MKINDYIEITNENNLDLMKRYSDKYFDLAIVDPSYGIGISKNPVRQMHKKKDWDNEIPSKQYFDELFRVSKNQIIWGGNYFDLPPSQGFYIWDKKQPENFSLAMCEYAWSSIQKPAKIWSLSVMKEQNKIHPTQKPIELYEWIIMRNAEKDYKILDTHLGSGSIAIAIDIINKREQLNLQFVGCELDIDYYNKQLKELKVNYNTIFILMKIDCIIGIDPGAAGGIVVWRPNHNATAIKMPKDINDIRDLFNYYKEICTPIIFLEKLSVRPDDVTVGDAGANMGKLYRIQKMLQNFEHLKAIITVAEIPFVLVNAMKWQNDLKLRIKVKGKKEEKADRKRRFRDIAGKLYPEITPALWNADATLIMHFGRFILQNNPRWVLENLPQQMHNRLF